MTRQGEKLDAASLGTSGGEVWRERDAQKAGREDVGIRLGWLQVKSALLVSARIVLGRDKA